MLKQRAPAIGRALGLDRAAVMYGLTLFLAATLAFAIASQLHVQNAYWAAMPVWVVAQAQRGLLIERAIFRVVGTLAGSLIGFAILTLLHDPVLALIALSIWVTIAAGLTHLFRRANSYAALMAGITSAVVVLPSLLSAEPSLELALARVECTLIGVVVVTILTGLVTPNSQRDVFFGRVRLLAAEVVSYAARVFESVGQDDFERHVLAEISELETAADTALAGSIDGYRRMRHVNALVAASLALMATAQTLKRRGPGDDAAQPFPTVALTQFAERLHTDRPQTAVDNDLRAVIAQAQLQGTPLGDALAQLIGAQAALCVSKAEKARPFGKSSIVMAPRYEWGLARDTGMVCGSATLLTGLLALLSGSYAGELAALGVCMFSMVLGSMPKPQVVAPHMFKGVIAGVIAATFYRFALAPHVTTVAGLILSIAPFIFVGALARTSRKTAMPALDANMCFMLASQAVLPMVTDTAAILSGGLAILLAGTLVTTGFRLLPRRSDPLAVDAAKLILRDLHRLISGTRVRKDEEWQPRALRQTLRMMLHLGRANTLREKVPKGMLAALSLGNAVVDIRALIRQPGLSVWESQILEEALDVLADFETEPRQTAERLLVLTSQVNTSAVATALRDAAYALIDGARLFELNRTDNLSTMTR